MNEMLTISALASDECSKAQVFGAWQGVAAFTYDWSASVCPGVFFAKASLKAAVDGLATAESTHGLIAGWDVSRVDDMSEVFQHKNAFNDDIGAWDTSRVTNMQQTLKGASSFNLELAWDTSKVTNMEALCKSPGPSASRSCGIRAR